MLSRILILPFLIVFLSSIPSYGETVTVGSKKFTENYILAEIFSQYLEDHGYVVNRRFGMGGTMVAFNALKSHEIDVYPDYTGTISEAILKTKETDIKSINRRLDRMGLKMLPSLGFDNSYSLVMKRTLAEERNIRNISDLVAHPDLIGALSFEFQARTDGWKSLIKVYPLKNKLKSMEIPLTYEAVKTDRVDFAEAYTTEPLIKKLDFVILKDDRNFFIKYHAVPIVHTQLSDDVVELLSSLAGKISEDIITDLNGRVIAGISIPNVANQFLVESGFVKKKTSFTEGIAWNKMWQRTQTHLFLTGLAVILATLVAVPFASVFAGHVRASRFLLGFTGVLQTIPSIALLTFMIPFFGIGFKPAIVGLFIYSLLPILRNTHTAMIGIDPRLITAAKGIGLYPSEIFFSVKLPLAFPTILAGVRTATILNIGTATLAAFIGAGGLGEPIVTGLALNDTSLVLQGAVPAAVLAIVIDGIFSLADRKFSKHI